MHGYSTTHYYIHDLVYQYRAICSSGALIFHSRILCTHFNSYTQQGDYPQRSNLKLHNIQKSSKVLAMLSQASNISFIRITQFRINKASSNQFSHTRGKMHTYFSKTILFLVVGEVCTYHFTALHNQFFSYRTLPIYP